MNAGCARREDAMGRVLIVYHTLGGNTEAAALAVKKGCESVPGTTVVMKKGFEAGLEDLLACDAIAIGTGDYFSYPAGAVKDFFDRTLYPARESGKTEGKPCVLFVTHGGGGKAAGPLENIAFGSFKFRKVADTVSVKNRPDAAAEARLAAAGRALAEAAAKAG